MQVSLLFPVLKTVYNSLHVMKPHNVVEFVGLGNYGAFATRDDVFWKAVKNTAIFALFGTSSMLPAACYWPSPVCQNPSGTVWKVVWFSPVLISYVVVGIIWVWIYDYDWGVCEHGAALGRSWAPWSMRGWAIPP